MKKLQVFKGMEPNERVRALESVINGEMRLIVLVPEFEGYALPEALFDELFLLEVPTLQPLVRYSWNGGLLEPKNGRVAAMKALANIPHEEMDFLDEAGNSIVTAKYEIKTVMPHPVALRWENFAVTPSTAREKARGYLVNTPEFAAVMDVWERYWARDTGNTKAAVIVRELQDQGFTGVRAQAIEMICRPEKYRTGGRTKNKSTDP